MSHDSSSRKGPSKDGNRNHQGEATRRTPTPAQPAPSTASTTCDANRQLDERGASNRPKVANKDFQSVGLVVPPADIPLDRPVSQLRRQSSAGQRPGAYFAAPGVAAVRAPAPAQLTAAIREEADLAGGAVSTRQSSHSTDHNVPFEAEAFAPIVVDGAPVRAFVEENAQAPNLPAQQRKHRTVGFVLLSAALIGLAVGIPLSLQRGGSAQSTAGSTQPTSVQADFDALLSNSTLNAIRRNSTPQARAYQWLFAPGGSAVLPADQPMQRLLQRFALATLYYSTGGDADWINTTGWLNATIHECRWNGVGCGPDVANDDQADREITRLDMPDNGMSGSIPAELEKLTNLQLLRLGSARLSGAIPTELGNLGALTSLSLRTIPPAGGSMSELGIPPELGLLTKLQELWLESISLAGVTAGTIPTQLGKLVALRILSMNSCPLRGRIPTELGMLTNLTHVALRSMRLTGTIPTILGDLVALTSLYLNGNPLKGTIPTELGLLTNLQYLGLDHANFSGTIPSELGNLVALRMLTLSDNPLSGTIPTELGFLTNLTSLQLKKMRLYSTIPTELGKIASLTDLAFDDVGGTLPTELGLLTNLEALELSQVDLSGTIPTEIGNLSALTALTLGSFFTGRIPTELGLLANLEYLGIYFTGVTGMIPKELGKLSKLKQLDLSINSLSGRIPTQLGLLTKLTSLLLNEMSLSGTIPTELCNLPALTELLLYSNNLKGRIPTKMGMLTSLTSLLLYDMGLSGTIPTEIGMLGGSLTDLILDSIPLVGTMPTELRLLTNLEYLWLPTMSLTGTIPTDLGQLTLLYSADLSSNRLNGTIPAELGQMKSLQELKLHGNQLVGTVPEDVCARLSSASMVLTIDCDLVQCPCEPECSCGDP